MKRLIFLLIVVLAVGVMAGLVNAQVTPISYTRSIEENFDSVGPTGTKPPTGWIIGHLTNTASRVDPPTSGYDDGVMLIDDGGSTSKGNVFNYGTTGDSDRALGAMPTTSGFGDAGLQVALKNDTGAPITLINLTYTGEQWRIRQSTPPSGQPEILRLYISTTPDFQTGTFEKLPPEFEFEAPQTSPTETKLDGNDPANRVEEIGGEYTLTTPIATGATFYITWHDWNDSGTNDHPLAVDDVVIGMPGVASLVAPIDWALIDLAELQWLRPEPLVEGDTVLVDVLFGTEPNLIVGVNGTILAVENYDGDFTDQFGRPLDLDTVYYWRVDVIDPNGGFGADVITGNTWSFVTTVPAEVIVTPTAVEVAEEGETSDTFNISLSKAPESGESVTVTIGPTFDPIPILDLGCTADNDDAEEHIPGGTMESLTSSDLELGWEANSGDQQLVGLRFNNVDVPNGATITSAYMQFNEDEATSGECNLTIAGQLSPDVPSGFTSAAYDISSRPRTIAEVAWTDIPAWSGDNNYQTPDITSIISEITGQGGWMYGNSLVLFIEPDADLGSPDKRVAESSDHDSKFPLLHIEWTVGTGTPNWPVSWTPSVVLDDTNWEGVDVTVTAVDDAFVGPDPRLFTLETVVTSVDELWNALPADDVVVSIIENDCGSWGFAPVDINKDCVVDLADLAEFASQFGRCTDPHFPAVCDDIR